MLALRQINALLKKNFLLKRRRKGRSLFEIVLPVFVFFIIGSIRSSIPDDTLKRESSPVVNEVISVPENGVFLYSPSTSIVEKVVSEMNALYEEQYVDLHGELNSKRKRTVFKGFKTKKDLIEHMKQYECAQNDYEATPTIKCDFTSIPYLGAVMFDNVIEGKGGVSKLPNNVQYTLTHPYGTRPVFGRKAGKWHVEFLQKLTDYGVMKVKAGDDLGTESESLLDVFGKSIQLVGDASSSAPSNSYAGIMATLMITATSLSFLSVIGSPIKDIIMEKEKRIKEAMKMMGLKAWVNWTAWAITIFFNMFIVVVCSTFIVIYFKVFKFVDPVLFFTYYIVYCLSTIGFIFLVSTLFNRSKRAATFLILFYVITFAPYMAFRDRLSSLNVVAKDTLCLANSACMAFGVDIMGQFEEKKVMLSWSMIGTSPSPQSGGFTILYCMMMMLVDGIVYFLLAYYIDEVFPGEYGIPRKALFFLDSSYWTGYHKTVGYSELPLEVVQDREGALKPHIETEPSHLTPGVQMRNLTKVYDNGKVAVNDLSLNIYENQITALLGHNGAGKTTIMSMLSGLFPPTGGSANICGHDLSTDLSGVRRSLGLCPQFDVLFDKLTVMEHLWFFSELKGVSVNSADSLARQHVQDLGLLEKLNSYAENLSGGQKRKLSVAIAFVGNSKIIILDEPTSGMDPYSRRATWDLLIKNREDKTIILSTHFMDEADILGDRIAIVAKGSLRCVGSSLFLKTLYGVGYHLTLEKKEGLSEGSETSLQQKVTKFVRSHIPEAETELSFGNELSYTIPSKYSQDFETFFSALEQNLGKLNLEGYGISATTLEEVFLAVGNEVEKRESGTETEEEPSISASAESVRNEDSRLLGGRPNRRRSLVDHVGGFALIFQQIHAMLVKRALNAFRQKKVWLYQVVYPLIFVYFAFSVVYHKDSTHPKTTDKPVAYQDPKAIDISPNKLPSHMLNSYIPFYMDETLTASAGALSFAVEKEFEDGIWGKDFIVDHTKSMTKYFEKSNFVMLGGVSFANSSVLTDEGRFNSLFGKLPASSLDGMVHVPKNRLVCGVTVTNMGELGRIPGLTLNVMIGQASMKKIVGGKHSTTVLLTEAPEVKTVRRTRRSDSSEGKRLERVLRDIEKDPSLAEHPTYLQDSLNANRPSFGSDVFQDDGRGYGDADMGELYMFCFYMAFSLTLVINAFSMFVVREKATNAKEIQLISSHPAIFWTSHFIWDFSMFLIPLTVIVVWIKVTHAGPFVGDNLLPFVSICLSYGFAGIMQVYLLSLLFDDAASATSFMSYFNSLTVIVPGLIALIVNTIGSDTGVWHFVVHYCFIILPNYLLCSFFFDFVSLTGMVLVSWEAVAWHVGHMMVLWVSFFVILLFFECGVLRRIVSLVQRSKSSRVFRNQVAELQSLASANEEEVNEREDEDVYKERLRVKEASLNPKMAEDDVLVCDLSKVFHGSMFQQCCPRRMVSKDKLAVNQISVGIPSGECFGLLGHNGAGKTTTFKMLTGTIAPSFGDAWLLGKSTVHEYLTARKVIGYCPQENAFIDHLTTGETLTFYARMRGIKPKLIVEETEALMKALDLKVYEDVQCESLSGGNKRKLMTACSLIGDPSVLFLDEPSTGMDPKARRVLWDNLQAAMKDEGRCIILTSHSMEECEALCTRLAIMIDGTFRCLGSPQHLKNKFGSGYILIVKTKTDSSENEFEPSASSSSINMVDRMNEMMTYLQEALPSAVLVERQPSMVRYSINQANSSVGQIFGKVEKMKRRFPCIEDYSLSQTSLEQVFINFVKASGKDLSAE